MKEVVAVNMRSKNDKVDMDGMKDRDSREERMTWG